MGCSNNWNNSNVAGDFFDDNRRNNRRECEAALEFVRGVEDLLDEFYQDERCDWCRRNCRRRNNRDRFDSRDSYFGRDF